MDLLDNIQGENSVRFTLSFHEHRNKIEITNQNLIVPLTKNAGFFFTHDIPHLEAIAR